MKIEKRLAISINGIILQDKEAAIRFAEVVGPYNWEQRQEFFEQINTIASDIAQEELSRDREEIEEDESKTGA